MVIGPGSILTSSKIGASEGYSKVWVVLVSVFFMLTYTQLAARLGVASQNSVGDLIRRAGPGAKITITYARGGGTRKADGREAP